jgi:hypothetical protein
MREKLYMNACICVYVYTYIRVYIHVSAIVEQARCAAMSSGWSSAKQGVVPADLRRRIERYAQCVKIERYAQCVKIERYAQCVNRAYMHVSEIALLYECTYYLHVFTSAYLDAYIHTKLSARHLSVDLGHGLVFGIEALEHVSHVHAHDVEACMLVILSAAMQRAACINICRTYLCSNAKGCKHKLVLLSASM